MIIELTSTTNINPGDENNGGNIQGGEDRGEDHRPLAMGDQGSSPSRLAQTAEPPEE